MSAYVWNDAPNWIRSAYRVEPSPLGCKVAWILGVACGGIYNVLHRGQKVDWTDRRLIEVNVDSSGLATWDSNHLTTLVLLCHEARIRMDIGNGGPHRIKLCFWQRSHEGGIARRHPNVEELVADFRRWFPADHPIAYGNPATLPAPAEAGDTPPRPAEAGQ